MLTTVWLRMALLNAPSNKRLLIKGLLTPNQGYSTDQAGSFKCWSAAGIELQLFQSGPQDDGTLWIQEDRSTIFNWRQYG